MSKFFIEDDNALSPARYNNKCQTCEYSFSKKTAASQGSCRKYPAISVLLNKNGASSGKPKDILSGERECPYYSER